MSTVCRHVGGSARKGACVNRGRARRVCAHHRTAAGRPHSQKPAAQTGVGHNQQATLHPHTRPSLLGHTCPSHYAYISFYSTLLSSVVNAGSSAATRNMATEKQVDAPALPVPTMSVTAPDAKGVPSTPTLATMASDKSTTSLNATLKVPDSKPAAAEYKPGFGSFPKSAFFIIIVELCERFAYYG